MDKIKAPFTQEQVDGLNAYQKAGIFHEYTCGNEHEGNRILVATVNGLRCPTCDYNQVWAYDTRPKIDDLMQFNTPVLAAYGCPSAEWKEIKKEE